VLLSYFISSIYIVITVFLHFGMLFSKPGISVGVLWNVTESNMLMTKTECCRKAQFREFSGEFFRLHLKYLFTDIVPKCFIA
jgi:hypothetical protein